MSIANGSTYFAAKTVSTWPPPAELEELFGDVPGIEGTFLSLLQESTAEGDQRVANLVACILEELALTSQFCGEDGDLLKSYTYANNIVKSRAHDVSISKEPNSILIWPLLDLVNGVPQGEMVNITPRQDEPAALVGKRDLCKGEELLMDYGPHPASRFVQAYGICPNVFWERKESPTDILAIHLGKPFCIDPSDRMRQERVNRFEYCNCAPYRQEYFLFSPEDLRKWEGESEFPWCLRDLVDYTKTEQIRSTSFHCPFQREPMRQGRSGKLTKNIRAKLLKILDYKERRLSKPQDSDLEAMKDQSSSLSSKQRTAIALNQFALNALAEWRRMIIAAPPDDDFAEPVECNMACSIL